MLCFFVETSIDWMMGANRPWWQSPIWAQRLNWFPEMGNGLARTNRKKQSTEFYKTKRCLHIEHLSSSFSLYSCRSFFFFSFFFNSKRIYGDRRNITAVNKVVDAQRWLKAKRHLRECVQVWSLKCYSVIMWFCRCRRQSFCRVCSCHAPFWESNHVDLWLPA